MKQQRYLILLALSASLFFSTALQAGLMNIVIEGGGVDGLPIAIPEFTYTGTSGASQENARDLTQVIRADLGNSGQFKILTNEGTPEVEDWVRGQILSSGSGQYEVVVELLDVVKRSQKTQSLMSLRFQHVKPSEFRALAHHISDLIFEKLIGVKGVFSTRIAYVSVMQGTKGSIYTLEVADSDGFNPRPLFRSNASILSLAWSPDGRKIAFVSYEKERISVNVVEVSTARVEKVSQFPGMNNAPAWSPDGTKLAVVLSKDGPPKIYVIDLLAKTLRQVTEGIGIDTEPCFAPDGQSLVFTSDRGGKPQIYRVTLNTGRVERLTFKGDYNARPSLTPDGSQLVTLHRGEGGGFCVAVHHLKTGGVRILTGSGLNNSPAIAPNGMMVMYGSRETGREVLGAVTLDGRLHIRLPAKEGDVREPAWGPLPKS